MTDPAPSPVETIIQTAAVTAPTRAALRQRLDWRPPPAPLAFDTAGYAVLVALCDRLAPQPQAGRRVDLAALVDTEIATGGGDGWRYADLPPDRLALTLGVGGVDQDARARFGRGFADLAAGQQDAVLTAVQAGDALGAAWTDLPPARFFEELLALVCALYFSHPYGQDHIGYLGMADADGFYALGLNALDRVEIQGADAAL